MRRADRDVIDEPSTVIARGVVTASSEQRLSRQASTIGGQTCPRDRSWCFGAAGVAVLAVPSAAHAQDALIGPD
jgi:hypothetical protein